MLIINQFSKCILVLFVDKYPWCHKTKFSGLIVLFLSMKEGMELLPLRLLCEAASTRAIH